jgi:hypothetical protein
MPLFRRRRDDLGSLLEQRAQLAAELEQVDADAAWAAASDDRLELNDALDLRRQADALRRSLHDLDARIDAARDALQPPT